MRSSIPEILAWLAEENIVTILADCYVIKFQPTRKVLHPYFSACINCIISIHFSFGALSVAAVNASPPLYDAASIFDQFLHCFPFFFFSTQYYPGENISERN